MTDPAPRLDALIVSHGQPSDPDPAEAALADLLTRVQAHTSLRLGAATLAKPGQLEQYLTRLRPGGVIYPLFMSDGWFVRTALAKRLGDAPVRVAAPFGIDPKVPDLVLAGLAEQLGAQQSQLLVVAHGSASGRAAPCRAALDFAKALQQRRAQAGQAQLSVTVCFLEQSPRLRDVVGSLAADVPCLPFFAMAGDHVRLDLAEELASAGLCGPILPVISQFAGTARLMARRIEAERAAQPTAPALTGRA